MTTRYAPVWDRLTIDAIGRHDCRYRQFIATLHDMADILWEHAEHRVVEHRAKKWVVVWLDGEPAAWCAYQNIDGVMHCTDGFERPGPGREYGLYEVAYGVRQQRLALRGLPAVTYLFEDPPGLIGMYERDGWVRTGATGPGEIGSHVWWELQWTPGRTA